MANEPQQPLLPAEPWYTSDVAVKLVTLAVTQVVSLVFRLIGHFTDLQITTEFVDLIIADLTQVVAVVLGLLALWSRKKSDIQPLTLTRKGADKKADQSILDPQTLQPKATPPVSSDDTA